MKTKLSNYSEIIRCPECKAELIYKSDHFLCSSCQSSFKIHRNFILKLFTKENIYPTKEKINWKND